MTTVLRTPAMARSHVAVRIALGLLWSCCAKPGAKSEPHPGAAVTATVPAAPVSAQLAPERSDPQALAELLQAVPSSSPPPTNPQGGTLIGSATKASAEPTPPAPPPPRFLSEGGAPTPPPSSAEPAIATGKPTVQQLSSPMLERAARAQIYWQLARACRMPGGELPPADSVWLHFIIRGDGTVLPGSVRAGAKEAKEKEHEAVADCVERVFSASGFRGPAEGRHTTVEVLITWPSVD